MSKSVVAVVKYKKPLASVREAVALSGGLNHMPSKAKVLIKPNIVFWTKTVEFPKWGVITTSRTVEDMVEILKERGVNDIVIVEGIVTRIKKELGGKATVVATGGYGNLMAQETKSIDIVNPDITLIGLRLIYQMNKT